MRKNKATLFLCLSVLLVIISYCAYEMVNQGKEEYYTVSVIVNDSNNERWNAFREGLEQGAEDNNIYLNLVSTGKFQNAEEENTIVRRELEGEAQGIIVEPYSSEENEISYDTLSKPAVLVLSGMESENLYTTVMTDHEKIGQTFADTVKENKDKRIGIFSGNQRQQGIRQRLKALKEALADTDVEIVWVISAQELERKMKNPRFLQNVPVDAIVSLENDQTEKAVELLKDNNTISCHLYGEGRSEKTLYYLDKGIIQKLLVPNEYFMGYESMAVLAQNIKYHAEKTEQVEVDVLEVTKKNLYDEDTSRILFSTVR